MKPSKKILTVIVLAFILLLPSYAFAHQPRIVRGDFVEVSNPEISQAFYGELKGKPVEYQIKSDREFKLYVGLLVPDIPKIRTDISAEIYLVTGNGNESLAILDGSRFEWKPFYEPFGGDHYLWGPEFKDDSSQRGMSLNGRPVPAGDYRIKVFNPSNQGKYCFVTGYLEEFPPKEIINALIIVPQLKLYFFNEPMKKVLLSPMAGGSILFMFFFLSVSDFSTVPF